MLYGLLPTLPVVCMPKFKSDTGSLHLILSSFVHVRDRPTTHFTSLSKATHLTRLIWRFDESSERAEGAPIEGQQDMMK